MSARLIDLVESRNNNFNLLRFGAATAVFISHCPSIAGLGTISITTLLAYVAVNAFFVISGFLVTKSLFTRPNLVSFLTARALRIYPALILAVLYTVWVVGLAFSDLPVLQYFRHDLTQDYLFKNALQLFWPIPATLPGLSGWGTVNAPLWTLPFELHMYLFLLLVGYLGFVFKSFSKTLWGIYIACIILATMLYLADYAYNFQGYGLGHDRNYLRFLSMFGIGVMLFLLREKVVLSTTYFVIALLMITFASPFRGLFVLLAYGLLGYVLLYLAYIPGGFIRWFNQLGDYSYGIYIFGYPTQKAVMHLIPGINVIQLFLIAFSVTLLLAVLSWHFVERPALKLKLT